MKPILFILLLVYCSHDPAADWSNMTRDTVVLDRWKEARGTFAQYPVECHYKAVLFFEEEGFKNYLQDNAVPVGTVAIDVNRGKYFAVRQEAIMDTVLERRPVLRGFKTKLEETKK